MDDILINAKSADAEFMQQIIASLKDVKEAQNLSVSEIEAMVDKTGEHVSKTTLYRVFADDSDNDSFSYEHTLRPIARALLVYNEASADTRVRAQLDTYLHICQYKMEVIERLQEQNRELEIRISQLSEEYNRRVAFLRDQIELKDARMDKKDDIIDKLLGQFLNCKSKCDGAVK